MRIPIPSAVLLAALLRAGSLGAQAAPAFPIDTALARRYFREAAQTVEPGSVLWSLSLAGPILLVDPGTRTLLAERPDAEGRLHAFGDFFAGTLAPSENVANTALRWGGVSWAMLLWPLPADSIARSVLGAHELWHRIQDSLGFRAANPSNAQLATRDGRLWLRLEGRALRRALDEHGAARARDLRDAIGFRLYRRKQFPGADSTERQLELNEGLAEYTGITTATAELELRKALTAKRLATLDTTTHLERNFAYQTGPAYGFFLDQLDPAWRARLTREADLALLLQRALGGPAALTRPTASAVRYGYAAVLRQETAREKLRRNRLAALSKRFVSGPLLELPLAEMKLGFDPGKVEALGSVGTIYGGLRLSDRWGVLQCDDSGGLIGSDWTRLIVPAPSDTSGSRLIGPGWVLELAPGWRLAPGRRGGDYTVVRGER